MVKLPPAAGVVDRSVWPIAAPLARVAELLRVDLTKVTDAAERVAPYITAEADVVRDEGEAYADKLRDAGVPVDADRFQAIIHDFVMLNALADTNAARGAIALATDTLRAVLSDKH